MFHVDNLFATIFVYLMIGLFLLIPLNLDFLDPLENAISDFEITDLVFTKLRDERKTAGDTNIVIINIGHLSRKGIAREIEIVNQYHPKVIGVDAFFWQRKSAEIDEPLITALNNAENLVLVSKLENFDKQNNRFTTLKTSHPIFMGNAATGFANFITEEFRTVRRFSPREDVNNKTELAFAARIARLYNAAAFEKLMARRKKSEIINFRGNMKKFYLLDIADVFNPRVNLTFLKDKIVLLGYLGESIFNDAVTLEDKFFTPVNERYAGKTYPDMYGVVIHANIISMIIHRNYINELPSWLSILLAIILCYLNIAFFSYIYKNHDKWYDGITKIFQFLEAIFLLFVIVLSFHLFNYNLELTLALVVIILSGDLLEVYYSLVKNLLLKLKVFQKSLHL